MGDSEHRLGVAQMVWRKGRSQDHHPRPHRVHESPDEASELYDLIGFLAQSFVRPVVSELYAIKHNDITISDNPVRFFVRGDPQGQDGVLDGTHDAGGGEIRKQYRDAKGEDYIILQKYKNRQTAVKIIQRQFRALLVRADLETDKPTGKRHTLYSLRHTPLCMRIVKSKGGVNIFTLAKNAGTSVDQIERFYARHLPVSKELWQCRASAPNKCRLPGQSCVPNGTRCCETPGRRVRETMLPNFFRRSEERSLTL